MHRPAFALSVVVAAALAGFALAKCSADRAPDPSLAPVDEAVDEGVDPGPAVEGEEGEERGPAGAAQEGRREIADVSLRGDFNPLEPAFKSQSKHREVVVFRVRSVTRGAPVANARVYILGFEDLYADSYAVPHVASAKRVAHVIERLVEAGASARSDSRGDVRLPVGDAAALVFCEHGQESVLRALTPKDLNRLPEARTLSLLPRRELRVALRDTKGTAVQGLPVSIAFPEKIQPIWLRQGSTDARGRVAIERASETLMLRQRGSWDGRVLAALVRADIPGLKRQKRVELATRTTQCSLVVPPTGSMLVRHRVKPNSEHVWTTCLLRTGGDNASPQTAARFGVANADGLREARFAHVALRQSFDLGIGGRHRIVVGPTRAGQEVVVDLTERPLGALRLELQDASGQAMHGGEYGWSLESLDKSLRIRPKIGGGRGVLFEELPIGQQFRVTIQRGGAERTVVVAGPSKVGEVKSARVTWASGPGIQLRVFGPDAKVMRGALISYSLSTSRGTQEGSHWRTDADGVFRLDFKGQTAKREIHFFEIRHEAKDGRVLFARREIGRKADQGRIDLGDVRLAEAAALLTGRVLVDGKAPRGLRKPFVSVEVRDASTADGRWVQGAGVEVSVERGGAFRVTGDPSIAQLRLRASYDQCLLGDWKELSRGASDVELSLASAAQFRAGFLVDDAELLSHLVVELVSDDANADARPDRQFGRYRGQARRSRGSKGGSTKQHLHWAGIPVGRYSLRVLALGTASAPLVDIPGIQLRPRRLTTDARSKAIDLRGRLHALELKVVDADEKPITCTLFVECAKGEVKSTRVANGRARVVATRVPVRVRAVFRGAASAWTEVRDGDTVRLGKGLPVAIEVPATWRPPAGVSLELRLGRATASSIVIHSWYGRVRNARTLSWLQLPLKPGESTSCRVPGPGQYLAEILLFHAAQRRVVKVKGLPDFDVDRDARVRVELSQAELDAAMKRD